MKKELGLDEDKKFLEKLEQVEESLEALENVGVESIVVDSPSGHRFYTLVGSDEPCNILIDTVNEAAACLSMEGTVLYCNARFGEVLKTPVDHLISKSFFDHLSENERSQLIKKMHTDKVGHVDAKLIFPNGTPILVYLHFSRITINHLDRIHILITDMSQKDKDLRILTEMNQGLEESIKARDSFLAAMSHNLRTPLNSIIGFADILLAKIPGPLTDEQEKHLQIISRCSRQLITLIRQLLDVGLIQHDKLEPVIDHFDINLIVANVIQEVKPIADQKNVRLSAVLVQDKIVIPTDKKLFRQVIVNLLDNSIKYTEKGSVRLIEKMSRIGQVDYLEIQVTDTGVGIKKEDIPGIFQLYSSVSKKEDPYGEHTGLGLMLCCKYCEALGMTLTCESVYGKGSTFIIKIPMGPVL